MGGINFITTVLYLVVKDWISIIYRCLYEPSLLRCFCWYCHYQFLLRELQYCYLIVILMHRFLIVKEEEMLFCSSIYSDSLGILKFMYWCYLDLESYHM